MIHFHKYKEVDRYLMFTGEDAVIYKCEKCNKEKVKYTLETYIGLKDALPYKEWLKSKNIS
jgi:hypothetical protein